MKEAEKAGQQVKQWLGDDWTSRMLPYIFYLAILGIFYISNSHYSDKTTRKINKVKSEVEELRTDYTTLKAETLMLSKRSEIAQKVANIGIIEADKPAYEVEMADD
ncbi:MAG: hypothetical protein EAZ97_14245 [Bacteroidetes bacterium]|nr:MAG: hypothetical protein EAZ97_14245 [Bacteroidota bacterium]